MRGLRGWLTIKWYKTLKNKISLQAVVLHLFFRFFQRQIADRSAVVFCLSSESMNCLGRGVVVSKAGTRKERSES